jgi:hypothetical protein
MGWSQLYSRAGVVPAYVIRPIITTTSLPQTDVGVPYLFQLSASNGVPPYTWIIYSGALPPGLSLSSSGLITGTAQTAGTFNVVFQCFDSN